MGKGRWQRYRDGMPAPARQHVEDRRRLERALRRGQFAVHYQPIVDLATAEPVGFEALIRLHDDHPATPAEIIASAEDTGLMPILGAWVLEQALAALPALNPPGSIHPRYVSVNVSARQLQQRDFVQTVRDRITQANADPRLLVLEVTENLLVTGGNDPVWTYLDNLRDDGIRIALDDYGTGHASIGHLRQPAFDIVKIDKSFLSERAGRNQILLDAVIRLCQRLDLEVIVEGVENTDALHLATTTGAHHGQGFHYAPALALADAAGWRFDDGHR
jgi:EAL domain-containing protein (putative c-di-GMP-specific phosphodiesterase class I)